MSQEASSPQEMMQLPASGEPKSNKEAEAALQGLLDSLRSVQEDIGQICELASEEKNLIATFFQSLLNLMRPLAATIPVSPTVLSAVGNVTQAYLEPAGYLIILYKNGKMELKNLSEEANRDLLVNVAKDILPKFKQLTIAYREKMENRIKFLSTVTRELQKISQAFASMSTP